MSIIDIIYKIAFNKLTNYFSFLRIDDKRIIDFHLTDRIHNDLNSVLKILFLLQLELEHIHKNISELPEYSSEEILTSIRIFSKMVENAEKIIVI